MLREGHGQVGEEGRGNVHDQRGGQVISDGPVESGEQVPCDVPVQIGRQLISSEQQQHIFVYGDPVAVVGGGAFSGWTGEVVDVLKGGHVVVQLMFDQRNVATDATEMLDFCQLAIV